MPTLRQLLRDLESTIRRHRPLPGHGLRLEQTSNGQRLHLTDSTERAAILAAASLIPARLTGGGPGPDHLADLYAAGLHSPPSATEQPIHILGLHADATVPPDTWLLVTPDTRLGQLPLWL